MNCELSDVRRIIKLIRPYVKLYSIIFVFLCILYALSYIHPYLFKILIDSAIIEGSLDMVWKIVVIMFIVAVIRQIMNVIVHYLYVYFESKFFYDYQRKVFIRLMQVNIKEISNRKTGDIIARSHDDIKAIEGFVSNDLSSFLQDILFVMFGIGFLIFLDWRIALITVPVLALVPVCIDLLKKKVRKTGAAIRDRNGRILSLIEQVISGAPLIRAHSLQPYFMCKYDIIGKELKFYRKKMAKYQNTGGAIGEILVSVDTTIVVLGIGGSFVIRGTFTLGGMIAFHTYVRMMLGPSVSLFRTNLKLQQVISSIIRVDELLTLPGPQQLANNADVVEVKKIRGLVSVSDVSFRYDPDHLALNKVSCVIPAKTRTAVVGASGSGKTTLISLLCGLLKGESGTINIDGIDIKYIKNLSDLVSVVLQDSFLFDGTVHENLVMGAPGGANGLSDALRLSKVDFIRGIYDPLDSRGASFSYGERQRLCLARALLRNTPIILLDEVGANLDPESEASIQEAIRLLAREKTIILATHRLFSITDYDQIIFLDGGKVVESGTHDQLMELGGAYSRLYSTQMKNKLTPV